jgi:t-SNARE complex subunit (syntaxin)
MAFSSGKNNGDYRQVSLNESDNDGGSSNGYHNNYSDVDGHGTTSGTTATLGRQQQLLQQQDQGLEMLGQSADRLGQMSMQISEELGFQNKILNEMDDDLDEAYENLDIVTRKTQEFIQASGGTKNFLVIMALILVIVVLVLLIVYI